MHITNWRPNHLSQTNYRNVCKQYVLVSWEIPIIARYHLDQVVNTVYMAMIIPFHSVKTNSIRLKSYWQYELKRKLIKINQHILCLIFSVVLGNEQICNVNVAVVLNECFCVILSKTWHHIQHQIASCEPITCGKQLV